MRIAFSSPDGLGDFVLRLPMVEALLREGHALQLLMRPPAADLATMLLPEARVHVIRHDPWHEQTRRRGNPFGADFRAIDAFQPDLYVASAFQRTFFDEEWLARGGWSGHSAGFAADPELENSHGPAWEIAVPVPRDLPETRKNQVLLHAIAGRALPLSPPRPPADASLAAARVLLRDLGLSDGDFVVICVGSRPGLVLKDWGEARWTELLVKLAREEKRALLFLGNVKEAASIERIRALLPSSIRHVSLASEPPHVAVTHAVIALSAAYLGRDSGLMHLAAATGRPLVALFGGAHWPRFVPQAARGTVLTRSTPCRGCNFSCPFPEPYCVASIPEELVLEAWGALERTSELRVIELPPEESWLEGYPQARCPSPPFGLPGTSGRESWARKLWQKITFSA